MAQTVKKVQRGRPVSGQRRVKVQVTLPPDVLEQLRARAKAEGRSLSNMAATLINAEIEERRGRLSADAD